MRQTLCTFLLIPLLLLATGLGCASRSTGHIPSDIARDTSNVQQSVKVLIKAVSAAELSLTPAQKTNATLQNGLDQFYKSAYSIGSRGEQIADALVAYEAATDAATKGTIAARIQALLPLLQGDLKTLTGINLGPIATSEVVQLVTNVNDVVKAIQNAAQQRVTTLTPPQARLRVAQPLAA